MAYATPADLLAAFGAEELRLLADRDNDGEADAEVIAAALTNASAIIDGYIARAVTLPLPAAPPVLVPYCCDIARYTLSGDREVEAVKARYDAAIRYLRDIAEGRAVLAQTATDASGATVTASASNAPHATAAPRVFDPASLRSYYQTR